MRKFIIALSSSIVVLIVIICAVLVWNILPKSLNSERKQLSFIPDSSIDSTGAVTRCSEALKFKTIAMEDTSQIEYDSYERFITFLRQSFPLVFSQLSCEVVNKHSLLLTWKGSDAGLKPFLILAHYDVVPVAEESYTQWKYPPFSGTVVNDTLWGRGTMDDKARLMAIFESVESLVAQRYTPQRTIFFAFGHDEELGGRNGQQNVSRLLAQRGVQFECVIDEGPCVIHNFLPSVNRPIGLVGIGEKGYMTLKLSVTVPGGHSSMPPQETAIGKLSRAIVRLEEHPRPLRIGTVPRQMFAQVAPYMPIPQKILLSNLWLTESFLVSSLGKSPSLAAQLHSTCVATLFQAGDKENVLPGQAYAVVNIRILPGEQSTEIFEYVRTTIADSAIELSQKSFTDEPPPVSRFDAVAALTLRAAVATLWPESVVVPTLLPGGTDSHYYRSVATNIYRFSPMEIAVDDLKRYHGVNERISVGSYLKSIHFFRILMTNALT